MANCDNRAAKIRLAIRFTVLAFIVLGPPRGIGILPMRHGATWTSRAMAAALDPQSGAARQPEATLTEFDSLLNAGKYAEAEAVLPRVAARQPTGSAAELERRIGDKYNAELSSLKLQAADGLDDANALEAVIVKLNDLARRAGARGESARDYARRLQAQIARLGNQLPEGANATQPHETERQPEPRPEVLPIQPAKTVQGVASSTAPAVGSLPRPPIEVKLYQTTSQAPLPSSFGHGHGTPYPQEFLDSGFRVTNAPDTSRLNVLPGTKLDMALQVGPDGAIQKLMRCISGPVEACQQLANAPDWRFSSPTVKGRLVSALIRVSVVVK